MLFIQHSQLRVYLPQVRRNIFPQYSLYFPIEYTTNRGNGLPSDLRPFTDAPNAHGRYITLS